jgi:hypothetical protein
LNCFSASASQTFIHLVLGLPLLLLSGLMQTPVCTICCLTFFGHIQSIPGESVNMLGGLSIGHFKKKSIYRVSQEECARLRESVPYVEVCLYNPKHLCPKLNGYGDNGQRILKLWQVLHTCWLPNTY